MNSQSKQAWNKALKILNDKIENELSKRKLTKPPSNKFILNGKLIILNL